MRTMTEIQRAALDLTLGSGLTSTAVDNARAVMALRAFPAGSEARAEALALIMRKRANHRAWLTLVQREWQAKPRTVSDRDIRLRMAQWGNRHSVDTVLRALLESRETRERYVRCG